MYAGVGSQVLVRGSVTGLTRPAIFHRYGIQLSRMATLFGLTTGSCENAIMSPDQGLSNAIIIFRDELQLACQRCKIGPSDIPSQ